LQPEGGIEVYGAVWLKSKLPDDVRIRLSIAKPAVRAKCQTYWIVRKEGADVHEIIIRIVMEINAIPDMNVRVRTCRSGCVVQPDIKTARYLIHSPNIES
jgi:hypothetical protein